MSQRLMSWLCVLCLLPVSFVARAETDTTMAELLMRQSGMWLQLGGMAPQVRAGFQATVAKAQGAVEPAATGRIVRVIDEAYAADRLRSTSRAVIAAQLDATHVPELRRWYESELGKRVSRMEEAAAADARDPQVVVQEGAALAAELSPERRALLEEFITVTHTAETMTMLSVNTLMAMNEGISAIAPEANVPPSNQLRAMLEAQRPQMLKGYAGMALAMYAKNYDTLPTADLQRYVGFLKSGAGQHFNHVSMAALDAALTKASTEFGRGVALLRPPAASQPGV